MSSEDNDYLFRQIGRAAYVSPLHEISAAFEVLRKNMPGDATGEELAAFAGVDKAIRNALSPSNEGAGPRTSHSDTTTNQGD